MAKESNTNQTSKLLDEIINDATELPLEGQYWILAVAKGMALTRTCILQKDKRLEKFH